MQKLNIETLLISMLFYKNISIMDCKFIQEMFEFKTHFDYVTALNEGLVSGQNVENINQNFLTKKELLVYSEEEINTQLKVYKESTILQMFYKQAIDRIWSKKDFKDTNSNLLEELSLIVESIKQILIDLDKKVDKKNPFDSFIENLALTKERLDNGDFLQGVVGLKSSLPQLDLITGGFKEGEYVIIAGRPSMGKTSVALDIGMQNVKEGKKVLVLSLEMTSEQLIARAIPKINNNLTLQNTVYAENLDNKLDEVIGATQFLEKSGLIIEDFSEYSKVTIIEIQKVIELYFAENGYYPDLIILDYIQIVKDHLNRKDENQIITDISSMLQRLAKKTKTSLIVLSQLNRGLEERSDKRPMNSDLRGSGSLEQDADIIIFVYREAVYLERSLKEKLQKNPGSTEISESLRNLVESDIDIGELIVAKNRNGARGTATSEFYKPAASYVESASVFTMNEDLEAELEDF